MEMTAFLPMRKLEGKAAFQGESENNLGYTCSTWDRRMLSLYYAMDVCVVLAGRVQIRPGFHPNISTGGFLPCSLFH